MSPLVGLAGVPLALTAASLFYAPGSTFAHVAAPLALLRAPPSPTHALPWARWTVPPRDYLLALDLTRLAAAYLVSALLLGLLNAVVRNTPPAPAADAPKTDPRRARSVHMRPSHWLAAAAALYVLALRILALRSVPAYAATLDARARTPKNTGPPFQDVGAMAGAIVGFLLCFRELGNLGDRIMELTHVKEHRNVAQVGHVLTGAPRFFLAVALFRRCVVQPTAPY